MRFKFLSLFTFFFLYIVFNLTAQDKIGIKFGKVSPEDFNIDKLNIDTTNGAVIIADVGTSSFQGNSKGWFTLVFKHQCRIKIINKNGFDLANVEIPLYFNNDNKEEVDKIKAVTYNIENGSVVETKLDSKSIFTSNIDKNHMVRKFTMPMVKEGSIIEYTYIVNSDFLFNLHSWEFQSAYPTVWSEYTTQIPEFFDYVFLSQGYHPFFKKDNSTRRSAYNITIPASGFSSPEHILLDGNEIESDWVMKDVPALKEEKYTSSLKNHIAKIEFQLSGTKFPNTPYHQIMEDWNKVGDELLKSDDFGAKLNKGNNWLDDPLKSITNGVGDVDKARNIYNYIKNNIKSTGKKGVFLTKSIKDVFTSKSGSAAEVNLLLVAMLKHEDLEASPVLLSTIDHGYTHEIYPLLDRFNYVIAMVKIDSVNYYLDGSERQLGFGYLPTFCYNGHARIIKKKPAPVYFLSDTLKESKVTNILLFDDKDKWSGTLTSNLGYNESWKLRNEIAKKGKSEIEKDLSSSYKEELSISDIKFNDIDSCDKPVTVSYHLSFGDGNKNDFIYLNPMINEGYSQNFFKSSNRKYPVEMPYKIDEIVTLYMDIPPGYVVDEMPKSAKVTFNETDGYFEYLISKDETSINFRSRIKLEKATFSPEEYEELRMFFDYIVKKHSEQIVFKLKK